MVSVCWRCLEQNRIDFGCNFARGKTDINGIGDLNRVL
jgi:hypothetical protein